MRHPNGYGSVVKMSGQRRKPFGARLTIGYTDDGKQRYKYIGYYESRTDAMIALAEYNKQPYDLDASTITLAELYARYVETAADTISAPSAKLNKTCYNHAAPLHNYVFKDLRKAHLQGCINALDTPTAKNNVASFFRKLYRYAIEEDIVLKNYADFVVTPPKNTKSDRRPFTRDEIDLLWTITDNINAEILLVLAYSGMRISELLTLTKDAINLDEHYIIAGSKTEAGRDRYIPIHPRTADIIRKHYDANTVHLFTNRNGDKPIRYDSFHAKRFTKLMNKLGIVGVSPHSTRHFFVSELHRLGADKIAVQKIVGHKGDDVTEHTYTHIDRSDLHAAVALIT